MAQEFWLGKVLQICPVLNYLLLKGHNRINFTVVNGKVIICSGKLCGYFDFDLNQAFVIP